MDVRVPDVMIALINRVPHPYARIDLAALHRRDGLEAKIGGTCDSIS